LTGSHRPRNPVKGIHTIVDAFKRLAPDVRAELIVHGLPGDADYERSVRRMAAGENRIVFGDPVARADIFNALAGFDVLAVPSLWMETGPLVVLEAMAVGTPILGSNLGGIAELVEANVSGQLLPAGDINAWSRAIANLADTPPSRRFPQPKSPPRSTRAIADEMSAVYERVVEAGRPVLSAT
jgi:glycosyltransferase involved in cell wall biosynthesis